MESGAAKPWKISSSAWLLRGTAGALSCWARAAAITGESTSKPRAEMAGAVAAPELRDSGGGVLVDDHAGVAHGPQLHVLGPVAPVERETQLAQQALQAGGVRGPDLGEVEAGGLGHLRERGQFHRVTAAACCCRTGTGGAGFRGRVRVQPLGALFLEPDQRPHGVHGCAFDVGLAEDVVEDLQ